MCGFKGFAFWRSFNEFPPYHGSLFYESPGLKQRGPDDRNILCSFPLILDHYRLSIRGIDMQESLQPRHNSEYIFSFNGEIYASCSTSLCERGVISDTDFLWNKLNTEGPTRFLQDLSGEFSVVVYDKNDDLLYLYVDYLGVKPLYYSTSDLGISFSSTIKDCWKNASLMLSDLSEPPLVDKNALGEYLLFRSFSGKSTGYLGIEKIRPGEMKVFSLRSQLQSSFNIFFDSKTALPQVSPLDLEDPASYCDSLVKMYSQSDIPVSLCLSGGIDSTVVLYSLIRSNLNPPCFSVTQGPNDPDFLACQEILRHLPSLDCDFIDISTSNPWNPLEYQSVHDSFDGWIHLPNAVYLDRLFRKASNRCKVILSGEGADELLGSYNRYRVLPYLLSEKYSGKHSTGSHLFEHWPQESLGLANEVALTSSFSSRKLALDISKRLNLDNGLETRSEQLLNRRICDDIPIKPHQVSELMQANDISNYLPSMLRRQDILSMKYSIECRVPLASLEFMSLTMMTKKIPKYRDDLGSKGIMRDIAQMLNVPSAITSRKKHGFPPQNDLFTTFLSSDFVQERIRSSSFCTAALERIPFTVSGGSKRRTESNAYTDLLFSLLNIALLGL